MTNIRTAYLLSGLPGSGKSTFAEAIAEVKDGTHIEGGEMFRDMAREELDEGEELTSEYVANLGAEKREESEAFFAEYVVGKLLRDEMDVEYPLAIDSIRNRASAAEFADYFDSTFVIWMCATQPTRLHRLQDRGRADEGDFTMAELLQRDSHELTELGVETIEGNDDVIDVYIDNTYDNMEWLYEQVGALPDPTFLEADE